MTTGDGVRVIDARERSRFEALDEDGELMGFADYLLLGGTIRFTHAETMPAYRGRGIAATIAHASLQAARDAGLRVKPDCPYYQTYVDEHPEWADVLEKSHSG